MRKNLFVLAYRFAIPIIFSILYIVLPIFSTPQTGNSTLIWVGRLLTAASLTLVYVGVTFLDQAPSKQGLRALVWSRYGAFRGDQFLPFPDPSSVPFIYFYNALGMSALTSLMIYAVSPLITNLSPGWRAFLALLNLVLLLGAFIAQYPAFREQLYPSNQKDA